MLSSSMELDKYTFAANSIAITNVDACSRLQLIPEANRGSKSLVLTHEAA